MKSSTPKLHFSSPSRETSQSSATPTRERISVTDLDRDHADCRKEHAQIMFVYGQHGGTIVIRFLFQNWTCAAGTRLSCKRFYMGAFNLLFELGPLSLALILGAFNVFFRLGAFSLACLVYILTILACLICISIAFPEREHLTCRA